MTSPLYPPAVQRAVSYAGEAGPLVSPVGWVLHVQDGAGSPWGVFERATSPDRRFSHLWVSRTGRVEQYASLARESWAQGAGGNPWGWSVETEGTPDQPLTVEQLDALARWHVWCGAPEEIAVTPAGRGIGTHGMGGTAWGGHPDCPGPIRAGQRAEILRRAGALRTGGPTMPRLDPADVQLIAAAAADEVLARLAAYAPPTGDLGGDGRPLTLPWVLARDYQRLGRIEAATVPPKPKP